MSINQRNEQINKRNKERKNENKARTNADFNDVRPYVCRKKIRVTEKDIVRT